MDDRHTRHRAGDHGSDVSRRRSRIAPVAIPCVGAACRRDRLGRRRRRSAGATVADWEARGRFRDGRYRRWRRHRGRRSRPDVDAWSWPPSRRSSSPATRWRSLPASWRWCWPSCPGVAALKVASPGPSAPGSRSTRWPGRTSTSPSGCCPLSPSPSARWSSSPEFGCTRALFGGRCTSPARRWSSFAVASSVAFGLGALRARHTFIEGVRLAEKAVASLEYGDYDTAAAEFDQAAAALERAHADVSSPWARGAGLVPVVAQHYDAAVDLSAAGASGSAIVAEALERNRSRDSSRRTWAHRPRRGVGTRGPATSCRGRPPGPPRDRRAIRLAMADRSRRL